MTVENRLGGRFASLAARVYYSYIATYPPFSPVEGVDAESQRQLHAFMRDTLMKLYLRPELIGARTEHDDCYKGNELNNSRPELIKAMEAAEGKFADFIEHLICLGKHGRVVDGALLIPKAEMRISGAFLKRLDAIGISVCAQGDQTSLACAAYPAMFAAWQAFSARDVESDNRLTRVITFIHARYGDKTYACGDFFAALIRDPAPVAELEAYLRENGYAVSNFDLNNKTRFAYVKWEKAFPGKENGCLRAYFNWRKENQLTFEFRVPYFRRLLGEYGAMDADLRAFVFSRLKNCDACGYCVQTDKSGLRPRLAMTLESAGDVAEKCPLFPRFAFNEMTARDAADMIRLFNLAKDMR